MMKKINLMIFAVLLLAGCQYDLGNEIDYKISLSEENTYVAGDPVTFLIDGEVDNLLFYSGEPGHEYKNWNRYTVSLEEVEKASLNLDIQPRYGMPAGTEGSDAKGLEIFVSKDFQSLKGDDAASDVETVKKMYAEGMQGWTQLEYVEGTSSKWSSHSWDISEYLDNFAIAIHFNPVRTGESAQRTYWLKGGVNLTIKGFKPSFTVINGLDLTTVMLNDWVKDPYEINQPNGSFVFNKSSADIICQGSKPTTFPASIDGWVFSRGTALNRVPNDKGVVIKNLQNYLPSYTYTFDKPGTYKVVFVGNNASVSGASQQIVEKTVTILDKVPEEGDHIKPVE